MTLEDLAFLAALTFSALGVGLLTGAAGHIVAEVAAWWRKRRWANGQPGHRSATPKRSERPANTANGQNGHNGHPSNNEGHEQ